MATAALALGCGGSGETFSGGSTAAPPEPPRDFLVFPGDGSVLLSWGFPDDTLQKGIHVRWGTPENQDRYSFVPSPRTRYQLEGLENGTTYAFDLELEHATGLLSGRTPAKLVVPRALDREAPYIMSVTPGLEDTSGDAAAPLAQDAPITVAFSEPMALDTVEIAVDPPRALHGPRWDDAGRTLSLYPAAGWAAGARHVLSFAGRDRAGNLLTGTATVAFTAGWASDGPSVVSISPSDGMSGVPLEARIAVTFDEPMDPGSVASALEVHPRLGCRPVPDETARTFTCTPAEPLSEGSVYGVLVRTTARARRGPALARQVGISFTAAARTTEARPAFVEATPASGAIGVPRRFELVLTFDAVMDQPAAQAALRFPSHPALRGRFTWTGGGRVLHFAPDVDLAYGERVRWTLDASAHALGGATLTAGAEGSFQLVRRERRVLESVPELDGTVAEPVTGTEALVAHEASTIALGVMRTEAGDDAVARGFYAFDLAELPEALSAITFAELTLVPRWSSADADPRGTADGADSADAAGLVVESIDLGFELNELDYLAPVATSTVCAGPVPSTCTFGPLAIEARELPTASLGPWQGAWTDVVARDWAARSARAYLSAIRVRLSDETVARGSALELTAAHPWVPEAYRPHLTVEYEVP